jgi:hypothetical protein
MEDVFEIVNIANRNSKVAKFSLSARDDRLIVSITAELLVPNPEDFAPIFERAISLLTNARNVFQAQLQIQLAAR